MFEAFSRSWEITKLSFDVIKKDRELLLFPLLAAIFSLIFSLAMLFPTVIALILKGIGPEAYGILEYVVIFLTYLGLAVIATFFNVCVVYTTKRRFEGGNATFGESIRFGLSKIHLILAWGLVSATVGLILRVIDSMAERAGKVGYILLKITAFILGMAWSIVTIFVVPGMVYHNLGPFEAIKRSAETLKKTWGENLFRYFGLGLAQLVFVVLGLIGAFILFFALGGLGAAGMIAAIAIAILYFLAVGLIFSAANTIFSTALYAYADTGKLPEGYSEEIVKNAFRRRSGLVTGVV
ncbi:MAG: hypothetical protein HYX24_02035 [Candidatus Aenigmarchaeota archaeon]|nr:hypothetical protein [Candidatus Aenigmarchaeota archaeon]